MGEVNVPQEVAMVMIIILGILCILQLIFAALTVRALAEIITTGATLTTVPLLLGNLLVWVVISDVFWFASYWQGYDDGYEKGCTEKVDEEYPL